MQGGNNTFVNINMSRTIKKKVKLNSLKFGCSTCFHQAKKMENKISHRNISKIDEKEFKKIISSLSKK